MSDVMLTTDEVARRLQVSKRFVLDEIRRKNLRASKTGAWRVSEADLETYVDAKANVSRVRRAS